jgi:hypothetical protein
MCFSNTVGTVAVLSEQRRGAKRCDTRRGHGSTEAA